VDTVHLCAAHSRRYGFHTHPQVVANLDKVIKSQLSLYSAVSDKSVFTRFKVGLLSHIDIFANFFSSVFRFLDKK
jgi:hypothetical protein